VTAYRLFPATNGPADAGSYSGDIITGTGFCATQGGTWFEGYWWWVAGGSPAGPTSPQKFALWQDQSDGAGTVIAGSVVTSGTLAAGWNYVPLAAPVQLATGSPGGNTVQGAASYIAATGVNGNFPSTNGSFGSGDTYAAGITSGPLTAFSDQSGSAPSPVGTAQGVFTTGGTDPSLVMPSQGSSSANFWLDVQVSNTAPAGYAGSYRLWPGMPAIFPLTSNSDNLEQTFGNEFLLSHACKVSKIWFYAPASTSPAALPTKCGIFSVATQAVVAGSLNSSPSWSGASGWVSCSYTGLVLPPGDYKACVFTTGGSTNFYQETELYWASPGPGDGGITWGPLSAPSNASATTPGQGTYNHGASFTYPATTDSGPDAGQNRWVDIEVIPVSPVRTRASLPAVITTL
jgi:hypothetical protein